MRGGGGSGPLHWPSTGKSSRMMGPVCPPSSTSPPEVQVPSLCNVMPPPSCLGSGREGCAREAFIEKPDVVVSSAMEAPPLTCSKFATSSLYC